MSFYERSLICSYSSIFSTPRQVHWHVWVGWADICLPPWWRWIILPAGWHCPHPETPAPEVQGQVQPGENCVRNKTMHCAGFPINAHQMYLTPHAKVMHLKLIQFCVLWFLEWFASQRLQIVQLLRNTISLYHLDCNCKVTLTFYTGWWCSVFWPPSAAKDSPRPGTEGGEEDGWQTAAS